MQVNPAGIVFCWHMLWIHWDMCARVKIRCLNAKSAFLSRYSITYQRKHDCVFAFPLTRGTSPAVIYAWFSVVWQWISWRLARVSHCGQTKHSQCILNERRLLSFNLNYHLAAKGSCTNVTLWASGGQVRRAQYLPCGICNKGQGLGNNNKTFFFKKSFLQSGIFHIHFMEHLICSPFPPRSFESVLFFNAPLPLLFCRHEGGFVMAAFGVLFQCPPSQRLCLLFISTWIADQCFYLIISAQLQIMSQCESGRTAIKKKILKRFYAPKLPFICVVFYALLNYTFKCVWTQPCRKLYLQRTEIQWQGLHSDVELCHTHIEKYQSLLKTAFASTT